MASTRTPPPPIPTSVGKPALRALEAAGFRSLDQLTAMSAKELAALHGVGPKAILRLREALAKHGLSLASG